jgi:hypothetical protein
MKRKNILSGMVVIAILFVLTLFPSIWINRILGNTLKQIFSFVFIWTGLSTFVVWLLWRIAEGTK